MLRLAGPEHGSRPSGVWHAVVEGGADGAFFVPEMRLHDRGEAIELASQPGRLCAGAVFPARAGARI